MSDFILSLVSDNMPQFKKSKKDDLEKLRMILDNPNDPKVKKHISKDDKGLDSIRKQLSGESSKASPISSSEFSFRESNSLEPRVTVHKKEEKVTQPEEEQVEPGEEIKEETTQVEEDLFDAEDLYEIEKIEVAEPEFLEVKPENIPKQEKTPKETKEVLPATIDKKETVKEKVIEEDMPEWMPVEETEPEPISELKSEPKPEIKEEKIEEEIPEFEKIEEKEEIPTWEPVGVEEIKEKVELPVERKEEKPSVEKIPEKKDKETAKKKKATPKRKEKKKETETKKPDKEEFKMKKLDADSRKARKKDMEEEDVSIEKTIVTEESSHIEKKLDGVTIDSELDVFKGINSIDQKTAWLLYRGGYTSVEKLRDATIKDIAKIKGIKRRSAKKIKKEVGGPEFVEETKLPIRKQKTPAKKLESDEEEVIEWESYHVDESTEITPEIQVFSQGDYTLYKKEIETIRGKKRTIHFFSKEQPDVGEPAQLPEGYEVKVKKSGLPYLKKKK